MLLKKIMQIFLAHPVIPALWNCIVFIKEIWGNLVISFQVKVLSKVSMQDGWLETTVQACAWPSNMAEMRHRKIW